MKLPSAAFAHDAQVALGYLNYGSGASDPQFLSAVNRMWGELAAAAEAGTRAPPVWQQLEQALRERRRALEQESSAFRNSAQAERVLDLVFAGLLPAYRDFHRDLLFHQKDDAIFNGFFVGRACEAVLRQNTAGEALAIVQGALAALNDYVGHRPLPVLESRKVTPYAHEWIRPVPLFIRGAGVAAGPYHEVVSLALKLLEQVEPTLLRAACFDPALLDELAFDPRAYDFDHPANKRPNYHFGQWDPHHLDNQARFRRFVVQQVALESLMARLEEPSDLDRGERTFEAAAVLAGIILMASGVSGSGPDTHDSTVTLTSLLPHIAAFRDVFYERLLAQVTGKHGQRLGDESTRKRQPFGGARQDLNAQLSRRRAAQLEHGHLARLFARMGYPEAAARQADVVPAASARLQCRIDCLLASGNRALDAGERGQAADLLTEIMSQVRRGIDCGALIDPWSILGFDAHYSLFPAPENSVRDHRADELTAMMERIFALYSRCWSEAAAIDDQALAVRVAAEFEGTCQWWHKFAVHEVESMATTSALETYRAAAHVAESLRLWHQGGAAAGDVKFWAPHAARFDSPRAYALVIEALLERRDFVASLALLVSWLSQAEQLGFEQGEYSFSKLAECWLRLWRLGVAQGTGAAVAAPAAPGAEPVLSPSWSLARKLFDYFEANAESFWQAPKFDLTGTRGGASSDDPSDDDEEDEDLDDEDFDDELEDISDEDEADDDDDDDSDDLEETGGDLFSAAYESMVYRDSTADGVESNMAESGHTTNDELERESKRLGPRLDFLASLARLWRLAAVWPRPGAAPPEKDVKPPRRSRASSGAAAAAKGEGGLQVPPAERDSRRVDDLRRWLRQAESNLRGLKNVLREVEAFALDATGGDPVALVEYDRRRVLKESLLERIIATCTETAAAARFLEAAALAAAPPENSGENPRPTEASLAVRVFAAMLSGQAEGVRQLWPDYLAAARDESLLYVPLAKGGAAREIVEVRSRQETILDLLEWLPRCGLLLETFQLIETAREMERQPPVKPGVVTEFDDLFEVGYQSLVTSLVDAAERWQTPVKRSRSRKTDPEDAQPDLVSFLETLTESLLASWLSHSRTLRLSVLEKVRDDAAWRELVAFIERYGGDLFTQKFFHIGNVRAILHQGVEAWLDWLEEEADDEPPRLLQDLDQEISRPRAIEFLSLVLEAILENFGEYRDYNSTTTQSDRGELLYMLLDFLRLRVAYDRVAWNLRPVVLAHEILVRRGQHEAAQLWRRALSERIREESDRYLARLAKLQKEYAMRMPTVADRLQERFMRPMMIDRIRALVEPAMRDAASEGDHPQFEMLEFESAALAQEPGGVGLDLPPWLIALEEEIERARRPVHLREEHDLQGVLPPVMLSREEIQRQLDAWTDHK